MKKTQYEMFETWEFVNFRSQWSQTFSEEDKYTIEFAIASDFGRPPNDGLIVLRDNATGGLTYRYMESFYDSYGRLHNVVLAHSGVLQALLDRKVKAKDGVLYWRRDLIQEFINELAGREETQPVS